MTNQGMSLDFTVTGGGEASGVGQPGTRGLNKRRPSRAAAIKSPHSAAPARENCESLPVSYLLDNR